MTVAKAPTGDKRPFIMRKGISTLNDLDRAPISITSSTVTLDPEIHAGRPVILNRAAGIAVVLPPATGSGAPYQLIVGTTFTAASTIKVTGDDIMKGTAILFQDSADTVVGFATASDSDTITLWATGSTTGGIAGEEVILIDMAADTWFVKLVSDAAGTEATPFSATV